MNCTVRASARDVVLTATLRNGDTVCRPRGRSVVAERAVAEALQHAARLGPIVRRRSTTGQRENAEQQHDGSHRSPPLGQTRPVIELTLALPPQHCVASVTTMERPKKTLGSLPPPFDRVTFRRHAVRECSRHNAGIRAHRPKSSRRKQDRERHGARDPGGLFTTRLSGLSFQ